MEEKEMVGNKIEAITKGKVLDYLDKHIELLGKERKELDKKISVLNSAKWELRRPENSFKCEKGLDVKETVCIGCDKASPKLRIWNNETRGIFFEYPGGIIKKGLSKEESENQTCEEWRRKEPGNACGCGGSITCECGYKWSFCFRPDSVTCPFCGRQCIIKPSPQYLWMEKSIDLNWDKFGVGDTPEGTDKPKPDMSGTAQGG